MDTTKTNDTDQKTSQESKPKKSGSRKIIFIIGLIFLFIVLICVSCFVGLYLIGKNESEKVEDTLDDLQNEVEEYEEEFDTDTEEETNSKWDSELLGIDSAWTKYRNETLGFAIDIPNEVPSYNAECEYNAVTGTYEYKDGVMPIIVLEDEDNDKIYITSEYYYELSGESKKGNISYFSKCNKIANTLETVTQDTILFPSWEIDIIDVDNDSEINDFIGQRYGQGCYYEGIKESEKSGIYDVVIGGELPGDPIDDDPTKCNINYITVVKYIAETKQIVVWDIGQACNFLQGESNCYDQSMVDSFELVK